MSLANISIVGNLVCAPERTSFSSGNVKTTLVVAVNTFGRNKNGEQTKVADFYRIEAWGKLGELAHQYLGKGNQVTATGRFLLDRWQDKEGKERITPVVKATQLALPQRVNNASSSGQTTYMHSKAVPPSPRSGQTTSSTSGADDNPICLTPEEESRLEQEAAALFAGDEHHFSQDDLS